MRYALASTIFFWFHFSPCNGQEKSCEEIFSFIYKQWDEVENMSYHSYKRERKMDEYEEASFEFVVQRKPYRVAGVMEEKRHRILYNPEMNESEALYISSGFPFTNLWLDIHGKVFRGLNHYTISNAGCEFIFGIIRNEYERITENFQCSELTKNGRSVYEIYAETDNFHYSDYTAQDGENLLDIATKFNAMAYLILEKNKGLVDDFTEDCGGKTLKIPSHYGSKVRLQVDATHGMPTLIEVFDEDGLIERYEYTNYRFDQKLPEDYFTEDHLDDLD